MSFRILVPPPISAMISSNRTIPIRPVGSTVTLTCTVVLAEYIDSLIVNTQWTGPNGFSENGMVQRMGSNTTYTSTAMVSSFGRNQSGNYTCTTTVSSESLFLITSNSQSRTLHVTVGKKCMGLR